MRVRMYKVQRRMRTTKNDDDNSNNRWKDARDVAEEGKGMCGDVTR